MLWCVAFLAAQVALSTANELLLAQAVWRHGDRTPTAAYPTDPYQEDFWPIPFGQLTTAGMKQLFMQGEKLRARYVDQLKFLSRDYSVKEFTMRSTDVDRALVSALSLLSGLYAFSNGTYPSDASNWPTGWTPIPVHTVDFETDNLLNDNAVCPRMSQLTLDLYMRNEIRQFMASKQAFLEMIAAASGTHAADIRAIAYLYDTVYVERLYNLQMPAWLTDEVFEEMESIYQISNDYLRGLGGFGTDEVAEMMKVKGGNLMGTIIANMNSSREGTQTKKFFGFSAHDSTMATMLGMLGAKKAMLGIRIPEYASTVIVELWKDASAGYQVQVLYIDNSTSPIRVITGLVSGCPNSEFCPLDTFIARSAPFTSTNIKQDCLAI